MNDEFDFGMDELLAALESATVSDADTDQGYTSRELAARMGVSHRVVVQRVGKLIEAGKAEVTRKYVRRIDGVWLPVSAYRLKAADGE